MPKNCIYPVFDEPTEGRATSKDVSDDFRPEVLLAAQCRLMKRIRECRSLTPVGRFTRFTAEKSRPHAQRDARHLETARTRAGQTRPRRKARSGTAWGMVTRVGTEQRPSPKKARRVQKGVLHVVTEEHDRIRLSLGHGRLSL